MKPPLVISAMLLAGLALGSGISRADTLQKIAASNRMTVSYREAAVPFSYVVGGDHIMGFAVDLTQAVIDDVRKQLGRPDLPVAYIPVTGQNRIPLLVNGSYDLECGSTTNNVARNKEVAFSINYFYAGTRVLVNKAANIRSYADLAGKAVATTAGSTNEKVIRQYSEQHALGMQWLPAKDYADSLALLESGRAAAVALDDILLYGLRANAANPAALEVVGDTLQVEPYACMLRKDDPAFKALVDGAIAKLMQSGRFARLYHYWFETAIPPKGTVLAMPMSDALKANLKTMSDKPER
ncbi:transporter substrate-binding domain-containing protein [Vogesella oryzae]|uniref:transporter substrate-binding domain-containing protein n=1 Tax=Vogesella oryzae TaxID=1735285 RepID=UPI001583FF46|nr:transporter substrate-binding domain-containing protein [Vogesella oryzae]